MAVISATLRSTELHLNHTLDSTKLFTDHGLIVNGMNFPPAVLICATFLEGEICISYLLDFCVAGILMQPRIELKPGQQERTHPW